jgi:hypothetical protein
MAGRDKELPESLFERALIYKNGFFHQKGGNDEGVI